MIACACAPFNDCMRSIFSCYFFYELYTEFLNHRLTLSAFFGKQRNSFFAVFWDQRHQINIFVSSLYFLELNTCFFLLSPVVLLKTDHPFGKRNNLGNSLNAFPITHLKIASGNSWLLSRLATPAANRFIWLLTVK